MTVTKKLGLFSLGTITVLTAVFIGIIHFSVTGAFDQLAEEELAGKADNVILEIRGMEEKCMGLAQALAVRADIIQAVKTNNTAFLQTACQENLKATQLGLITLADAQGLVLARGHSEKKGDSVATQLNVKKALAGESSVGIEEGSVVKFSLRAGAPIKDGATVIGSVTAGIDLSASHFFVDAIKSKYKVECTIFQKDTRLITTLQRDGKSLDGSKFENANILDTVQNKGQTFRNVNVIQNRSFNTVYWPLKGADGKIAGMFFIGKNREQIENLYSSVMRFVLLASVILFSVALGIGLWISRSIGTAIQIVVSALNRDSRKLFAVADQITESSQALAHGASSQAASLEETSASLEEMSATTKRNAEQAGGSKAIASETQQAAEAGAGSVREMIQFVDRIQNSSREMSRAMDEVMVSNREISKIIKTIDEIAFQTNILALNAAVEAARAGESGLGFAVVADEVRNLAQKSAAAAKETAEKIESAMGRSNQGAQVSSGLMEDFTVLNAQAQKVGADFRGILERIVSMTKAAGEIAAASSEQSLGIEQINKAVADMDRITQSNAAHAEESASAAKELNAQALGLRCSVGDMLKLVDNQSTTPESMARPQAADMNAPGGNNVPAPARSMAEAGRNKRLISKL